ncbi:hypothetical protein ACVDG5_006025 [Mesorhizobium sp. ORM6]
MRRKRRWSCSRSQIEDVRSGQPGQQHTRKEDDDRGEEPAQRDLIDRLVVVAPEQRTPQCEKLKDDGQCEQKRRQDRGDRPSPSASKFQYRRKRSENPSSTVIAEITPCR